MLRSLLLFLFIGLFGLLSAQVLPVGTVDGTVKDPTGALLVGAKVTLMNTGTGQSREATTSEIGYYFFPLVQPGNYTVSIEKAGFKKGTQSSLVQTGRRSTADFALELGQISESVQVSAQAALLETSTSSVSRNVQQKLITEIPLLGRNPLMLINLAPGVTNNTPTGSTLGLTDIDSVSYTSASGAGTRQNEFLLDGIPNNVSDRIAYIPSVDDVEEFSIQTNALDAEYGHGGGMYVNVATKGGTNEFHGSVYEFLRNNKLNANTWINNKNALPRAPFHFNQYGLTAGGPAIKNKVFWFFNFEGVKERSPVTYLFTTPTDLQRSGDFSQTYDAKGVLFQIADPLTTKADGTGRVLFANNKIPTNRINPIATNVFARFPKANVPGTPLSGTNNYYAQIPRIVDGENYALRVDPNINRHRLFARWSKNQGNPNMNPTAFDIGGKGVGEMVGNNRAQTSIGLSDAITFSPTMVVTAQAGYTRWTQEGYYPQFDQTTLGFPKSFTSKLQQNIFPNISVGDAAGLGAGESQWYEHTNTYSFNVGVTKISGGHAMKFGFQGQVKQNNSIPGGPHAGGVYSFGRDFTQPNPYLAGSNQGNGMATFLLGYVSSGSAGYRQSTAPQAPFYGWYFQDDFKVTSKLTLNLGLRYELLLGTTERYNRSTLGFDKNAASPIEAQAKAAYAANPIPELPVANFNVKGGLFYATPQNRGNVQVDYGSIAPRLGLAYRILPKTVLRTGFGVFHSVWWQPFVRATGFVSTTTMVTSLDGNLTPADTLSNPFPQGLVAPTGNSLGLSTLLGQSLSGTYDYWRKNQRNFRWSFGFQQELTQELSVELNYVGQRGTRLPLSTGTGDNDRNLNALDQKFYSLGSRLNVRVPNPFKGLIPLPSGLAGDTVTVGQLLVAYPQFSAVSLQRNTGGDSYYHSLQATVNKRFNHGLTAQLAYTWSKELVKLRFIEPSDPAPSKMTGEFDNPQRVSTGIIYELPFGSGKMKTSVSALNKVIRMPSRCCPLSPHAEFPICGMTCGCPASTTGTWVSSRTPWCTRSA
ncbi:MAG: carboxypeptidase-like regulatory domain-containing protein [Acidobacteria bacterium]|nr:carboxypeptidase-like regulatory domain-containing protein [Acidobacteriota bacterium]